MKCGKTLPSMSLAVALSVAGCGDSGQRDVYSGYNAAKRCADDWGSTDLCKDQMSEDQARAMGLTPNYGPHYVYFWGPYWSGQRQVYYNNTYYTPATSRALGVGAFSSSYKGAAPSAFTSSPSVRGGFGATGHSFAVSG